ncbi:MAG: hypothetical protein IJ341_04030 [Bacteroidales bacterium]|nr:hypothetical protein [Bacteroidales bacterium]MBQ7818850.1 hypothetical protein [Bacteroidales bacterium]
MVKYSDKIREIKEIGSNAYNLSLKTLEYSCDIYLEHSNYLKKGDSFSIYLMKQNLHRIIENRETLYGLKKRLISYRNDIDNAIQNEAIKQLSLVNTAIDSCRESIRGVEDTFGEEFKEENITPLFRQVENKSFSKDKNKSLALIIYIILLIIGAFLLFF